MANDVKNLYDLLYSYYSVKTHRAPYSGKVTIGTTRTKILSNDPNRVALTMTNQGSIDVYLTTDPNDTAGYGILLAGGGGVVSLDWQIDFDLLSSEWWAIVASSTQDIYITAGVTE